MRQLLNAFVLCVAAILYALPALGGSNAGGTALLSWSSDSAVGQRTQWSYGSMPLYLRLSGVAEVETLLVKVEWTPNNLQGPCYWVEPGRQPESACGAVFETDSLITFQSDSSLWAGHLPAPTGSSFCIAYSVGAGWCDSIPGRILIAYAVAIDQSGARDTLEIAGDASIGEGVESGARLAQQFALSTVLAPSQGQSVTITGPRIGDETQVGLVVDGEMLSPHSASLTGNHTITAEFDLSGVTGRSASVTFSRPGAPALEGVRFLVGN